MRKRYGIYFVGCESGLEILIKEYSTLKEACKEAYSLSRGHYKYDGRQAVFIVGNNTGILVNEESFIEYIRFTIIHSIFMGTRDYVLLIAGTGRENYIVKERLA